MEGGCCRSETPDVRCLPMIYITTVVLNLAVSLRPEIRRHLMWLPPIGAIGMLDQWYDDDAVASLSCRQALVESIGPDKAKSTLRSATVTHVAAAFQGFEVFWDSVSATPSKLLL